MNKYIYTTIVTSFLLSACSANGPLFHSFGNYESENQTKGIYLVEEPYEVKGVWYFPAEQYDYSEQGLASWYMPAGDSALTANGEVYDARLMTARHKTLPLPSIVKVTNLENNASAIVRVNDRGPMVNNRLIDLSQAAREALGMPLSGTIMVKVEVLADESKKVKEELMDKVKTPDNQDTEETNDLTLIPPVSDDAVLAPLDETKIIYKPEDHYVPQDTETKIVPVVKGDSKVALGSFMDPNNAKKLQTKLAKKYPVSIEQVERNGRTLNVVKVGPYSKEEVKTILKQLKTEGFKDAYVAQ